MKIVRVKIFEATSCGGLLDGMDTVATNALRCKLAPGEQSVGRDAMLVGNHADC